MAGLLRFNGLLPESRCFATLYMTMLKDEKNVILMPPLRQKNLVFRFEQQALKV